jgi:two-component system, OmpR family, response regulator QseB
MRILLVEDNEILGEGIKQGLKQKGDVVDWVTDGMQAIIAVENQEFDAIILDLGLPKCSGFEILKKVRNRGSKVAVLILTARDSIEDRIKGLDEGADDYMVKPIENLEELRARLRAVERRVKNINAGTVVLGNVSLSIAHQEVKLHGKPVQLSRREYALFNKLFIENESTVRREVLMQAIYGWSDEVDSNALEVHIYNLRKKFANELEIKTVRGMGYCLRICTPND